MMQLLVTPGPNYPKDLFSFCEPIVQELKVLENEGIRLASSDTVVNAHLLFVGDDIPATTKMAGLMGHTAKKGCKHCTIEQGNWSYLYTHGARLRSIQSYTQADESLGQ